MLSNANAPQYGKRLVPVIVDERAKEEPRRTWGEMPRSSNLADGYRTIDYATVANAINKAAHWLDSSLEKPKPFETCAYIGSNDFRYYILMVAAVKTGRKVCVALLLYKHHWRIEESWHFARWTNAP